MVKNSATIKDIKHSTQKINIQIIVRSLQRDTTPFSLSPYFLWS